MKKITMGLALLLLFTAGCGVNKDYVNSEIAASESRTKVDISSLRDKTDSNAAEVAKLKQLAGELGDKTEMAINKAAGFENYQVIWSGEINFSYDSYEIDGVAASILDECGMKLEEVPSSLLELNGYTDKSGSAKYNLMLGEMRSGSARRYLAEKFGVSLYRMFLMSYGESHTKVGSDEVNSASANRRVTLSIWGQL